MNRFTVAGGIVLSIGSIPAAAMDYSWRSYNDKIVIDAVGEIKVDEAKNFTAWIEQSRREWNGRRATAIVLNSGGGSVAGGREMGIMIADFRMITGVAHGGQCSSACVLIWSAGAFKSAGDDSKVGVHMASNMEGGDPAVDGTIFTLHWLQKTGAPNSVVVGAMSTKPHDVYWLSEGELIAWGAKIVPKEAVASKPSGVDPSDDELGGRERARAERLDKIVRAATKQLDFAAQFIREHPKNPKLLDYVAETAALKVAVEKGDPNDIERESTELSTELGRDQDYQQFDVERARKQKVIEAQDLGDAIRRAQDQRAFLVDYVTKNPLASEVTNFLPLIKQIGPALDKPSLDQLQRLTGQIDLAIREANLDEAFRAAQEDRAKPGSQTADGKVPDQGKTVLPTTDKNRLLLEGDLSDVLALYNAGANAPHVALNLRGQFVFANDRANVCLFGSNPDGVALIVRSALAPFLLKTITGLDRPCDPQNLETYDIVVTQRGAFLKTAQADALSVIKQIENGAMRQFALISASDIAAATAAERAAVEQIATDVAAGARNGFGVILLKSASPNLCVIAPEKNEAHAQLILRNADKLTFDMHVAPTLAMSLAEDAFVAAQKAQCSAVYASAADLKTISEGLARAGIPFSFSSLWITSAELDGKDAELAQKKRLDAQQSAERQQKVADEGRLRVQRAKDLVATEAVEQAELRAKYDGSAKAAEADIVADLTNWAQSQKGPVGADYPQYAAWLAEMRADHWEIVTTDSDVQDYGTSDFKGRPLDTAFARVTIRLRNRILGEYKDACFIFGRIADPEFRLTRDPIAATCEDGNHIKPWQTGHKFQSLWVVGG